MIEPEKLIYAIEYLLDILPKEGVIRPFVLHPVQIEVVMESEERNLYLKQRQIGLTTIIFAMNFIEALIKPNINCVSVFQKTTSEIVGKILTHKDVFMESYRKNAKRLGIRVPKIKENTKTSLIFDNRSTINIISATSDAGTSLTINNLHISELAKWENPRKALTSLLSTVTENGRVYVESTSAGEGGLFHQIVNRARGDKRSEWYNGNEGEWNGYKFFFIGANYYSEKFLEKRRKEYPTENDFMREYPKTPDEAFQSTGDSFFEECLMEVTIPEGEPIEDHVYSIGADVGEGLPRGDYSVAVVYDQTAGEQVKVWRGKPSTKEFAMILFQLSEKYNNALLIVERNNHGHAVIMKLLEYGANLYRHREYDVVEKKRVFRPGFPTKSTTRIPMLLGLRELMNEGKFLISSKEIENELKTFIRKEIREGVKRYEAMSGHHDDCVISSGLSVWPVSCNISWSYNDLDVVEIEGI